MVSSEQVEAYNSLEKDWGEAFRVMDFKKCDEIKERQRPYTFFRPLMTHSFSENAPKVPFHAQLLCDFLTIEELGQELLKVIK